MTFKINYKGSSCIIPFEYRCLECGEHTTIEQARKDDMRGRECPHCKGELVRYIGKPPSLDADYHESQKTHNLGWDS
jgi:DNA-directed RNA polymerase subunit RPC12/RpoP